MCVGGYGYLNLHYCRVSSHMPICHLCILLGTVALKVFLIFSHKTIIIIGEFWNVLCYFRQPSFSKYVFWQYFLLVYNLHFSYGIFFRAENFNSFNFNQIYIIYSLFHSGSRSNFIFLSHYFFIISPCIYKQNIYSTHQF